MIGLPSAPLAQPRYTNTGKNMSTATAATVTNAKLHTSLESVRCVHAQEVDGGVHQNLQRLVVGVAVLLLARCQLDLLDGQLADAVVCDACFGSLDVAGWNGRAEGLKSREHVSRWTILSRERNAVTHNPRRIPVFCPLNDLWKQPSQPADPSCRMRLG